MHWKLVILKNFKAWWTRLESLKTEEESWTARGRCSALEPKEATRSSMMVLHLKDLSFVLVSSKGCDLQCKDSRLLSIRSRMLTFNPLTLHHHHHRKTMLGKTQ
jgi:hypothetical protein